MKKRLLLIGIRTFPEIAEDGLVYIYRFVFPARPRRFGKSLPCFTLLTGVTKFSQVSIPRLNNLKDIQLNHKYRYLCGITQTGMKTCFEQEIE